MGNSRVLMNVMFRKVAKERIRQQKLYGDFWDSLPDNRDILPIATEEFGEIAKAINEDNEDEMLDEIIDTIAVLTRWYETVKQKRVDLEKKYRDES